jgi:hypothetical protein
MWRIHRAKHEDPQLVTGALEEGIDLAIDRLRRVRADHGRRCLQVVEDGFPAKLIGYDQRVSRQRQSMSDRAVGISRRIDVGDPLRSGSLSGVPHEMRGEPWGQGDRARTPA